MGLKNRFLLCILTHPYVFHALKSEKNQSRQIKNENEVCFNMREERGTGEESRVRPVSLIRMGVLYTLHSSLRISQCTWVAWDECSNPIHPSIRSSLST